VEIARSISDVRERALFVTAYLTAGRINEMLPKRHILRQRLVKETGVLMQWKEEISYPGITRKDIDFFKHNGREFVVVTMLNEKNRKRHFKKVPFPIERESELVPFITDYIRLLNPDDPLFPFTRVTAWNIMKKLGFNPHYMRHTRITHWVTVYHLQSTMIVRLAGWTDARPFDRYAHLVWEDIADSM
jgi:hypothetical protein